MASEQVDLPVVQGGGRVGSGAGATRVRILVLGGCSDLALGAAPGEPVDGEQPGVVEADLGRRVASEHEDLVVLGGGDGHVLGAGGGDLVPGELLAVPSDLVYKKILLAPLS